MELEGRGQDPNKGKPGYQQIHNPFLRTLATIGNVAASGLYPQFGQFIPGTSAKHNFQDLPLAERAVVNERGEQAARDTSQLSQANAARIKTEGTKLEQAPPPTITTDKGIMGWNPASKAYDIPFGTPAPKEELEGKTITTAQGILAWNPASHKYDVKVGDAPADKGAITHMLDKDGNALIINHDGTTTPVTGPGGAQVKGRVPLDPDAPITAEVAKNLNDSWNTIAPKYKLPLNPFSEHMSHKDVTAIQQSLNNVTGKEQAGEKIDRDPNTEKEYKSVHDDLNKKFATTETQLQNVDQAQLEINSGAMGQAFGTIKSLVALAGGQGSGVRITQAELDSIAKARGIVGTFEGWINGLEGKGKLSGDQVNQLNTILAEVKQKGEAKRSLLTGTLDKLAGAKSTAEIRAIEKEYRDTGHATPATGGSSAPKTVATQAEYDALPKGAKYVDAQGNPGTKK